MTVDSAYFPVVFANDGEVAYTVELESIGGVFQVYKVPDNGTARTLLVEAEHYTVKYEEHLDPIKKRAVITLAAPIASDAHLEVFRSTTIATDFAAEALKPFPSEQFEYTLDQICFIQQEIEGHLCGCPGGTNPGTPTYPPPVVPELPPECQPYTCDAFAAAALDAGMEVSLFYELRDGPPYQFDSEYIQGPGQLGTTCRIIASWVGVPLGTLQVEEYYLFNAPTELPPPDFCEANQYLLGIGSNPQSTTDNAARLRFDPETEGMALLLHGSIQRSPSGTRIFSRRYTTVLDFKDGNNWRYNQTRTMDFILSVNSSGELRGGFAGNTILMASPAWTTPGFFHAEISVSDMYVVPEPSGTWGTIYKYYVDAVWRLRLNDETVEYTWQAEVASSTSTPAIIYSNGITSTSGFSGTETVLSGFAFSDAMPDSADLYLAYLRNFADYEPPGTCPTVSTDPTSTVSSTPPVQGIFD